MTDQDEKKIEQDERPMTVKKKTQKEKQRVGQKTDEEEKKRKCIFCASDVETQPRPSQKKVLMNVELGTKRELGMQKKGFGPLAFSFFRVQTMYCGPRKDLLIVACGLQCSLLLLNDICLLLINQVVLGMPAPALTGHYRCPLFWPCPDSAVHGCSRW